VNILGYSERGALNALLFEISYSDRSTDLVLQPLRKANFLREDENRLPRQVRQVTAVIEQSFSDFGDADAILLLDTEERKTAVFIEAKVKPSQTQQWRIQHEYAKFEKGVEPPAQVSSSNLFTQLYHKVRLVQAAQCSDYRQILRQGIPFPSCSTKSIRKIGLNPVVLRALEEIRPYLNHVIYLGLIPDTPANVAYFLEAGLPPAELPDMPGWDTSSWGFLCWHDVNEFCQQENLLRTQAVLKFNSGQIW
jgi:hypothetical protein